MRRRDFLRAGAGVGLMALLPADALPRALAAAPAAGQAGRFLTAHEMATLRALVDRLIPGPPEDPDIGGVEALVPEAIDALLGAFTFDPPLIHAGGPFSNREGARRDDFAHFVPLDEHAELGWRIRLEGTKGVRAREFAGPVTGLQEVYRSGLAALDKAAGGSFAALPAPAQDAILQEAPADFVGQAFSDAREAMYGAPEYRRDKGLAGWTYTGWGDRQPRGHTPAEVSTAQGSSGRRLSARDLARARELLPLLVQKGLWRR
ncbi:MAG: gluconate 2-dehydrogenase subunit 3 family protein [Solirubrobacteraceae bacterium]|nr:gluconate 2-dehydrogenase subunit 3 family protein [Solirubrobacteraceae bacterium]